MSPKSHGKESAGTTATQTRADEREVVITRLIHARQERVYQAWTDPERLRLWWGPNGFTTPVCEMDVRPGGAYRIVMRSPEGVDYPLKGTFRQVNPPEQIVLDENWSEHPAEWHKMLEANLPEGQRMTSHEATNTIVFEPQGRDMRLTIRSRFDSPATRNAFLKMGMTSGWNESLDRLEELLTQE